MTEPVERWRVGNHQPRNIYVDNEFVAVAIGPSDEAAELAQRFCLAMNKDENEIEQRTAP